jgi:hypothetical protein
MYELNNDALVYALALFWLGRFGVEERDELSPDKAERSENGDDYYNDDEGETEEINLDGEWATFLKSASSQTDSNTTNYILSKRDAQIILKIGLGLRGYAYSSELYKNLDFFNQER